MRRRGEGRRHHDAKIRTNCFYIHIFSASWRLIRQSCKTLEASDVVYFSLGIGIIAAVPHERENSVTTPTDKPEQPLADSLPPQDPETAAELPDPPKDEPEKVVEPDADLAQEAVTPLPEVPEDKQQVKQIPSPALPGSLTDLSEDFLNILKTRLTTARDKHKNHGSGDAWRFNGGTIIALLCTTGATLVATFTGAPTWLAPVVTAVATVLIAIERALGWGARWRYHSELENAYECLIDMIDFYPFVPPSDRGKYAQDIIAALYAVRSRESAIPNAGSNSHT